MGAIALLSWKPHKIEDLDKDRKFPDVKVCQKHGAYYGLFCLKCHLEAKSPQYDSAE